MTPTLTSAEIISNQTPIFEALWAIGRLKDKKSKKDVNLVIQIKKKFKFKLNKPSIAD